MLHSYFPRDLRRVNRSTSWKCLNHWTLFINLTRAEFCASLEAGSPWASAEQAASFEMPIKCKISLTTCNGSEPVTYLTSLDAMITRLMTHAMRLSSNTMYCFQISTNPNPKFSSTSLAAYLRKWPTWVPSQRHLAKQTTRLDHSHTASVKYI